MLDYYDWLLTAIAAAMVAGASLGAHPAITLHEGLAGGSVVATALLYEAVIRNPPTQPTRSTTVASVVVSVGWLLTVISFL
jgi:hypothetical protein